MIAYRHEASVKIILALSLIHFIGDFYNSFIIPLLPLFIDKFSLTLAQAGLIAGLSRFLAFVVQPPVGYLADRHPSRFFALGGPLLMCCNSALRIPKEKIMIFKCSCVKERLRWVRGQILF